jgi:ABC-type nitrate/sulfonate/bicarbonate transport system ATPase subunit
MNAQKNNIILKAENISLNIGGNQILQDINIEIKDIVRPNITTGQIVGFLGPSGVGKTKFFEILSGLLEPTTGTVMLGDPLEPVQAGMVGVVQQNYPLFNHRTVEGNLLVAAKKLYPNEKEAKEKMTLMLDRFKLSQKQRIAIAQQLLCSKHFLLLDEPFSGLDINMIQEVQELITEIANFNELNTVIIVSHDIVSTASISDTLWLMGRDHDSKGNVTSGGKIKHTYDLIEMDLCYEKDILSKPKFQDLLKEIRGLFPKL